MGSELVDAALDFFTSDDSAATVAKRHGVSVSSLRSMTSGKSHKREIVELGMDYGIWVGGHSAEEEG